uniref:Uncharacterized protein LOC107411913 isoform X1 n=1 Tax=Rhizophora mucronata TaxID=61149 RepID=A0A2P2L5Z1_RHIMU
MSDIVDPKFQGHVSSSVSARRAHRSPQSPLILSQMRARRFSSHINQIPLSDLDQRSRSFVCRKTCSTFSLRPSLNIFVTPSLTLSIFRAVDQLLIVFYKRKGAPISLTLGMGLLDKLWDDTVAGPRPENGLGKLRKHSTFSFRSGAGKESDGGNPRSYGEDASEEAIRVTRSIMIVKPPGYQAGSPPASPAGYAPPVSPFSGSRESFRFRRKSTSDAYEKPCEARPSSPTTSYDV